MASQKPSLKVGFVLDGGLEKPDGVQQYILGIGNWLKSNGHQVRYIAAGKIAEGIEDAVSLSRNIKVISNGNSLTIPLPASRKKLKSYLKKEKFDVLHVQTPYSPMMGEQLILLSPKSTAMIGTFHIVPNSWYLSIGDWLLGHWCYFSLKKFDQIVSVSPAAQKIARRDYGIKTEVVPNIINYKRFHEAKAFSRYQDGKINILFFGRLVPRKGCKLLLEAIAHIKNSNMNLPEFRVIVCGAGPLENELKKFVSENALVNIVEFTGFVSEEDKPSFYASADISVFPSNGGESFGIVLLEALSSGNAAVLAGNNVGYASVLESRPETLFNPCDKYELAEKIEHYLIDKMARDDLKKWGEKFSANFDIELVGQKLLEIYVRALRKRGSQ